MCLQWSFYRDERIIIPHFFFLNSMKTITIVVPKIPGFRIVCNMHCFGIYAHGELILTSIDSNIY